MSQTEIHTGSVASVITTNTTTVLKAIPTGKVGQVVVWGVGTTATIDVYNDPATTNNKVWSWVSADGKGIFALQMPCSNGITVVTGGAAAPSLTVVWS